MPPTKEIGSLAYINERYRLGVEVGSRVRVYTGEEGTVVGSHPEATHYLWVLVDGDDEPIILHPTWKLDVLDSERPE